MPRTLPPAGKNFSTYFYSMIAYFRNAGLNLPIGRHVGAMMFYLFIFSVQQRCADCHREPV